MKFRLKAVAGSEPERRRGFRVLVRRRGDGLYLQVAPDGWVEEQAGAQDFESTARAFGVASGLGGRGLEVVMVFGGRAEYDCVFEVGG